MTLSSQMPPKCPLCGAPGGRLACLDLRRDWCYFRCPRCELSWRDPASYPDPQSERGQYELHENAPDDPGYQRFLARLADPLSERLPAGAHGLDYGCGPEPVLAEMLRGRGFPMRYHDPFFHPDPEALRQRHDFVVCSETAEHFHDPGREFARLAEMLQPEGWLGLMTGIRDQPARFGRWHYRLDPTHVCFYAPNTLAWLAAEYDWEIRYRAGDVTLFQKRAV